MWVSRVLEADHYKRMPCVTVGVARYRTLTVQEPRVPSIGHNFEALHWYDDVSKWVRNSQEGRNLEQTYKQTTNQQIQNCCGFAIGLN